MNDNKFSDFLRMWRNNFLGIMKTILLVGSVIFYIFIGPWLIADALPTFGLRLVAFTTYGAIGFSFLITILDGR